MGAGDGGSQVMGGTAVAVVIDEETAPLAVVAAELGVEQDMLRHAVRRGVIRADRIGSETYISRAEATVFVENQEAITDDLEPEWRAASDVVIERYRLAYIALR